MFFDVIGVLSAIIAAHEFIATNYSGAKGKRDTFVIELSLVVPYEKKGT